METVRQLDQEIATSVQRITEIKQLLPNRKDTTVEKQLQRKRTQNPYDPEMEAKAAHLADEAFATRNMQAVRNAAISMLRKSVAIIQMQQRKVLVHGLKICNGQDLQGGVLELKQVDRLRASAEREVKYGEILRAFLDDAAGQLREALFE